jgi:hypothetical protein
LTMKSKKKYVLHILELAQKNKKKYDIF